jgi:2-polyprenyl-6-methoxyphenol hydroxylase-like FAD-dependent oxidoreductase
MAAIASVLIAGGGIAGLVSARALALAGFQVTVLERRHEVTDEGGIGIGIQSNAMHALGDIGLAQRCVEDGVAVETVFIHAPDGTVVAEQPTARHYGTRWPGYTGIRRSAIHAILVDGARAAGITLLTDAELVGMEQDAARVHVALSDGRSLTADLLVGADGIHSTLREQLFPSQAAPQPLAEGVWRAFIRGVHRDDARIMYGGPVGTIGYTPLRDGLYIYVVDANERAPDHADPHLAHRLIALIGGVPGFPGDLMRQFSPATGEVSYRRLQAVALPDPWHVGRTILIGDAAHAGPPTLAQGAAMGIEDGIVLAECLRANDDVPSAFCAFMQRRYARVRTIMDASLTISEAQMAEGGRPRMIEAQRAAAAALALPY